MDADRLKFRMDIVAREARSCDKCHRVPLHIGIDMTGEKAYALCTDHFKVYSPDVTSIGKTDISPVFPHVNTKVGRWREHDKSK